MAEPDLQQIAFVTRHYQALRDGASRALLAPGLLLGLWLFRSVHPVPQGAVLACAIGLVFAPLFSSCWLDRRFGRVRAGRFHPLRWEVDLGLCIWLAAAFFDLQSGATGRPSMAFLALAAYGLWLVVKLRPYGFHNLLPTGVALVGAFAFVDVGDGVLHERWELPAITSALLAWTLAGVFDLRRLVRSLPHRRAECVGHEG